MTIKESLILITFFLLMLTDSVAASELPMYPNDEKELSLYDSTDGHVSDEAGLLSAMEKCQKIYIEEDIYLTESIDISNIMNLYGNDHKIYLTDGCSIIAGGNIQILDLNIQGGGPALRANSDMSLYNCKIQGSLGCGILAESGSVIMRDCDISDNRSSGIRIEGSEALVHFSGGSISGNMDSGVVINNGTFVQEDCAIFQNSPYGIMQNGRYEFGNNSYVDLDNSVFLSEGHLINISCMPDPNSLAAKIDLAENDRTLGRQIARVLEDADEIELSKLNDCFITVFNSFDTSSDESLIITEPAIRAGNSVNAPPDTMILSGMLEASYSSGIDDGLLSEIPELSISGIPEKELFYWKEEHSFDGLNSSCSAALNDNSISESMSFMGWNSSILLDGLPLTKETVIPAERLDSPITFDAVWDMKFDLFLDGNGNSNTKEAPNYYLSDIVYPLVPANDGPDTDLLNPVFVEGSTAGYFKKLDEKSSFAGWGTDPLCSVKGDKCLKSDQPLSKKVKEKEMDIESYIDILSMIAAADDNPMAEKRAVLTLYALWDHFPGIEVKNGYFTSDDVKKGMVTEEKLLENAAANDIEDGALSSRKNIFLENFNENDLSGYGEFGSFLLRYKAIDSAGNITYARAKVVIYDPIPKDRKVFTRFISKDNYYSNPGEDSSSTAQKPPKGAPNDSSIWYLDSEYANAIKKAFSSLVL